MLNEMIDLPTERLLAGFDACLDAAVVLDVCREQLVRIDPHVRDSWKHARMIEALYHPQRYLRVVYALLDDKDTPSNRLWPEGQLVYLNTPAREPMSRRGTLLDIGGAAVEAYYFPNDRRLRGLRNFAKRDLCCDVWQEWVTASGSDARIQPDTLQRLLMRYVPEQKWVVRLRAEWVKESSGERAKRRIAVRSASPDACADLLARHSALTRLASTREDAFVVPGVVGARTSEGLLATEWMRGKPLVETLAERDTDDVMRAVALRLRSFHAVNLPGLELCTTADLTGRMNHAAEDLAVASPALGSAVRAVAEQFSLGLEETGQPAPATLHNDFHWNQLSIKRDRYGLMDLERMARGDPLLDVANFATQLEMLGCRPEYSVEQATAGRWRDAFLEHWRQATGEGIDAGRFAHYAALSRLELARGMMRHLRPGWRALAQRCVDLAATDLAVSQVGSD